LREAFERIDIEGASTHSFRRTALTQMSNAGIPLRVIQEISGHRNLEQLQRYLEVQPDQVRGAIASLSMLSYGGKLVFLLNFHELVDEILLDRLLSWRIRCYGFKQKQTDFLVQSLVFLRASKLSQAFRAPVRTLTI